MLYQSWYSGFVLGIILLNPLYAKEKKFTIASFNVENLWDGHSDNTEVSWQQFLDRLNPTERIRVSRKNPQYSDYSKEKSNWYNPRIQMAKVQNLMQVIHWMGYPDIIGLQEIESAGNQSDVFSLPYDEKTTFGDRLSFLGYQWRWIGQQDTDNPTSVTTAFISKVPLQYLPSIEINLQNYSTSGRDIQVAEWLVGGSRVLIMNNHWKSKRGGGARDRAVFAKAIGKRIEFEKSQIPDTKFILLGDFNSYYYEHAHKLLNSTGDESLMLGQANNQLYNLWFELDEWQRWEHSFNGERSALSHIFISDGLYSQNGLHYVDQSFRAFGQNAKNGQRLLDVNGQPFRWQVSKSSQYSHHKGLGYSDHLPLLAEFAIDDQYSEQGKLAIEPRRGQVSERPQTILFDEIDVCRASSAKNLESVSRADLNDYVGQCVKIERTSQQDSLEMKVRGRYQLNYVEITHENAAKNQEALTKIGIMMTRFYDWRPNIDDSRVTLKEASIPSTKQYNGGRWHPRSNKCFTRMVLQKSGGYLRKAVGRLGYHDGELTVFVATRENHALLLEDLPEEKAAACPWNFAYKEQY